MAEIVCLGEAWIDMTNNDTFPVKSVSAQVRMQANTIGALTMTRKGAIPALPT